MLQEVLPVLGFLSIAGRLIITILRQAIRLYNFVNNNQQRGEDFSYTKYDFLKQRGILQYVFTHSLLKHKKY